MKVYKMEVLVIDFDHIGEEGIRSALEDTRYPNRCISPTVLTAESRDIGEWDDDNPLNRGATFDAEVNRLFGSPDDPTPVE